MAEETVIPQPAAPPLPEGYIPRDKRKKILLLSDDLRMPSGVGVMSREIVLGTAHRFNWVQLGAGINHPEVGKLLDASEQLSKDLNIPDAYLKLIPYNGYGDPPMIRNLMMMEKPDAILHFTDPRYWVWLYHMEAEIRENIPLFFYHVWDDLPYPMYNQSFYRSCDWISCISRQTYNIVQNVWQKEPKWEPWQINYIGHGVSPDIFKRLGESDKEAVAEFRKRMFKDDADKVKFVVLYNNRNIRRKNPGDVVLAYQEFLKLVPEEKRDECRIVFHTQAVDDNGTDIPVVLRDVAPEIRAVFTSGRFAPQEMNLMYNNVDVVVNMASNEGFGLSTLEGLMSERMIVANVTGGLQDQMGFVDDSGEFVREDKHFCKEWGSNHDGKYRKHGEWVVPVYPSNRSLAGSPPTPYIFDDRCKFEDVAVALKQIYDMPVEERIRRGRLGREYCMNNGFTTKDMCGKFIQGMETAFEKWKPRKLFDIYKV